MTDTTQAADDHAADDSALARMIDPKSFEAPPVKKETYGGDEHGIKQATDELIEERKRRAEAPIKKWKLDEDAPKDISAKDAAKRLSFNRTAHRAMDRAQRDGAQTGADAWKAGHITAQEMRDEAEPSRIEYQTKEKGETVNLRDAAKDLAEYRRTTAPAEAEALAEQRKWAAELGVADLIQQQEPAPPVEQPEPQQAQPEPQQPDPAIIEARQRAEYAAQALQNLHQLSQAEIVITHQMEQMNQQRLAAGINTMEDVARLTPDQQQKWAAFSDQFGKLELQRQHAATNRENLARRIQDVHQAQQAAAQQQQQEQYRAWKANQDQIAAKEIPELNDEQHGHTFRQAAHEVLKDYLQITPETARNLAPELVRALQYSGTQKLIADATRYRLGVARAKEVSAKQLPPVQRPGVSQPKGARQAADVAAQMDRAFALPPGSEQQKRAVASALAAQRQAAQRGR